MAIQLLGHWNRIAGGHVALAAGCSCGVAMPNVRVQDFEEQILEYLHGRHGGSWKEWSDRPAGALAAMLDYNAGDGADGETLREGSMLCAPLVTRDSLVGVLKIAARHPEQLKPFDAELVEHFRSQVAVTLP